MATINTTASGGLASQMQEYYDKKLIKDMKPVLCYVKHGQKRPIPPNSGKTVKFRKYDPFEPATTPLTEGVTPDGHEITQTDVDVTVAEYGDYVTTSSLLELTSIDPIINDCVELNAIQAGLSIEHVTRDVLTAGTNVIYAAGSSRSGIAAENKLTTTLVRKAVRALKKAKAKPFYRGGKAWYYAIVGPDTTFDLQDDERWVKVTEYQQAEKVESGEIGRLFGVIFIESTEAKIFKGAGTDSADVAATIIFGSDAYGVVDVGGKGAAQTIIHTSGGNSDPLNQRSTVAWKVGAYAACILQQTWIVRIEHGMSA